MGFNTQKQSNRTVLSEINVTPFVDVMLVLLIIFMVTTPILYQGVEVKLPSVKSKPIPAAERHKKIVITIDSNGDIYIEKNKISLTALGNYVIAELDKSGKKGEEERVFLKADSSVPYGKVVEVMAVVKNAGIGSIGLVTDPSVNAKKSKKR